MMAGGIAKVSLLMLTCNDTGPAIQNLKATKGMVDERIIVDSSSKKEKAKLLNYVKTDPSVKVFDCLSFGFPEPFMPFAVSKCRNVWILLLDSDEHPSPQFLQELRNFRPKGDANYITRYENPAMTFFTWQLRLFRKGAIRWMGFLHEHPKVSGKRVRLPKQFYLLHQKVGQGRSYDELKLFINHSRARMFLADLYIGLKMNPTELHRILKRSLDYTRKTESEKKLFKMITTQGIIRFLGMDKKGGTEKLISKYKGGKQGPPLLLHLVKKRYREIQNE